MPNSTPASASTRSGAAPGSWIQAREVDEFRYPTAHEVTVGVELFGLCRRVEDPKVRRGVGTGASDPLPVADVLGGVAVHQQATKVGFPPTPVHQQVLHQKGGDDHAHAVVHPAGGGQLTHAGVDDWIAGGAGTPRLKLLVVVLPLQRLVGGPHGVPGEPWVLPEQVGVPVAPRQLSNDRSASGNVAECDCGPSWRQGAEVQVNRQLRG